MSPVTNPSQPFSAVECQNLRGKNLLSPEERKVLNDTVALYDLQFWDELNLPGHVSNNGHYWITRGLDLNFRISRKSGVWWLLSKPAARGQGDFVWLWLACKNYPAAEFKAGIRALRHWIDVQQLRATVNPTPISFAEGCQYYRELKETVHAALFHDERITVIKGDAGKLWTLVITALREIGINTDELWHDPRLQYLRSDKVFRKQLLDLWVELGDNEYFTITKRSWQRRHFYVLTKSSGIVSSTLSAEEITYCKELAERTQFMT